ncbi:MAG: D-alanine--D-alanine ligase [Ktedonobacterales bacterium]|jgi:D-alanine-D-alanine ligase|nr:MAG: D-alanine--D-alanine ligase [Ktedonobacterales bacterium]
MSEKLRVGVIFGGRSGEHEVSVASAASVMEALDKEKYEIVPIGITAEGQWLAGADPRRMLAGAPMREAAETKSAVREVTVTGDPTRNGLVPADVAGTNKATSQPLDIVIPVLHGTYGEDGTLQGLLEMAGMAYAGCGVLGSALGMDKEKAKLVFKAAGLPVVDWLIVRRHEMAAGAEAACARIEGRFAYPVFVKPANMGSSVGVGKAHDREELRRALATALEFDRKALIEPGVNCRELECGVLGNDQPQASIVGEVVSSNEFYDYRAKYVDNASRLYLPAEIPAETAESIRRMAVEAFLALDLSGLARVDFFLDKDTGQVYINEVNTMPGFTQISMYPKLWEASGIPYPALLDRLIELGLERAADKQRNRTRFNVEEEA